MIVREGRPRIIGDGSTRIEYVFRFDEPQTDLTDEAAGLHIQYEATTVLEEYLRCLDDEFITESSLDQDMAGDVNCFSIRGGKSQSQPIESRFFIFLVLSSGCSEDLAARAAEPWRKAHSPSTAS